jgi:hypothetical protein
MRWMAMLLFLLTVWLWLASFGAFSVPPAYAQVPVESHVQAVTPSPAPAAAEPARVSPIVGILVLLAPAVWMAWQKSRPNASLDRKSGACLPIVDKE